jgi:hypothetical protein
MMHFMQKKDNRQIESIFTKIFKENVWHGKDSISGTGSEHMQTEVIVGEVPRLFTAMGIKAVLDIPCGDFHWMQKIDLGGINYLGADIVRDLIDGNMRKFTKENINFSCLDLTCDPLPQVDLIICRDCLVHFSYAHIGQALRNVSRSNSKYLLTTTFPDRTTNCDIPTGDWRPLNLEKPPFNLPSPIKLMNEGCTEFEGAFKDKSMGLWKIDDLKIPGLI